MSDALRCYWRITAGVLANRPEPDATRQFAMSAAEWEADEDGSRLLELTGAAMLYATALQEPARYNWVKLEWVWL